MVVTYTAGPSQSEDYIGCQCCVRRKQLDLPQYSSVGLSVTIRPDGIRLKGCISCLCYCDGKRYKNKPRGVEMGEQMSFRNGSIIHEAPLVTNVPIKCLSPSFSLSYGVD